MGDLSTNTFEHSWSMNANFCSKLLIKSCKWEVKERREDVHPGLGGNEPGFSRAVAKRANHYNR